MIFWAFRSGGVLKPDGVESASAFSRIPFGKPLRVEVKNPRNGPQHRLYWTLCQRIGDAIGAQPEVVSDILKIETGHCIVVHSKKHGLVRLPRSISFTNMEQADFNEFFQRCVQAICETWGIERSDVLLAVEDLLEIAA